MKQYRMKKTTIALLVASLSCSAFAQVTTEKPQKDVQYNEFYHYDSGDQKVTFQDSHAGKKQHYYFNGGALFDGSNGTVHSTILGHNWGSGFIEETAQIFHVGKGKDFTVKQYQGYGTVSATDGASVEIYGGNIVLESGITNGDAAYMDNTNAAVFLEDGAEFIVSAENLWIGSKRNDRTTTNALSARVSDISINLSGNFIAENVNSGITAQTVSGLLNEVTIHADHGISITSRRSDGKKASGYNGAGVYVMAFDNAKSQVNVDLTSAKGDVTVTSQGYAYYGYGNIDAKFSATNGSVFFQSTERQGMYLEGTFGPKANTLTILANENISIVGATYGIQATNAILDFDTDLNLGNIVLLANNENGRAVHAKQSSLAFDAATLTFLANKGTGYGISANNSQLTTHSTDLLISASKGFGVYLNSKSNYSAIADRTVINGQIYISDSSFDLTTNSLLTDNLIRTYGGAKINFCTSGLATMAKNDDPTLNVLSSNDSDSLIKIDAAQLSLKGTVTTSKNGQIDIKTGQNSIFIGATDFTDDSGSIQVELEKGSQWQLTDNSELTNLKINGTTLDFSSLQPEAQGKTANSVYRSLTSQTLFGDKNTLRMKINLGEESANHVLTDQLIIAGKAQGNQIADIKIDGRELVPEKWHSENWLVSQGANSNMSILNKDGSNQFSGNGMTTTWALAFVANGEEDKLNTAEGLAQLVGNTTGKGEGKWYLVRNDEEIVDPNPNPGPDPKPDPKPEQPKPNDPAEMQQITNLGISATQALSFASELEDLRSRLGEVRYGAQNGAWVRAGYAKETADGYNGRGFEQKTHDLHIGLDRIVAADEDSSWLVGGALRYAKSKQEGFTAARGGEGELEQYSAKLYATYMHAQGSYADFVVQAGRYSQDLTGLANDLSSAFKADYKTYGYGASVEIGHMFDFNNQVDDRQWFNHFFIEPQLQLSYFNAHGKDYKTSTGLAVSQSDADFLTGRAGVVLGKKFNYGTADDLDKRYFQVGLKGGVKYEFLGDQTIRFTGVERVTKERKADDVDGARYYYGVTADWQLSHNFRAYATVEREEGDHYTKDFDVSVGVKYQF